MKKKIVSIIAVFTSATLINYSTSGIIFAAESIESDSYDTFVAEEMHDNTGIIDEDVERDLNYRGVFDSDIRDFDTETVEKLNSGEEYSVSVSYYEESNDGLQEMSEDDVEDYFEEIYEEGFEDELHKGETIELSKDKAEEKSFLQKIGLEEKVYAQVCEPKEADTSKLKFTLLAFQSTSDKRNIYVSAVTEWISAPKYTMTDYMNIAARGKDTVFNQNERHAASYQYQIYSYGGSVNPQPINRSDTKPMRVYGDGFYTWVNLCDDTNANKFRSHKIFLNGYFFVNNNKTDGVVNIIMSYMHQIKKLDSNVNVNVSISADGTISMGLSSGNKVVDYYQEISAAPTLTFNYKVVPTYK